MTSLRQAIRRRFLGGEKPPMPDPALSYRFYWVGQARTWSPERRQDVARSLRSRMADPEFVATEYARRFRVPGLDDQLHAGQSLLQLAEVLRAMQD